MFRIVWAFAVVLSLAAELFAAPTCALLDPQKLPQAALLETKLLAEPGTTWVERANVDAVLKEQQLQAAFGPQGVNDRVKLGKLLKADLLVLVRRIKDAKEPALEITVCETAGGLRLLVRGVAITKDADADVAALQAAVRDGIKKNGEKIREVVAVPPFVSTDFEFTFDHLKGALAKLAEAEAFDRPGVVVVELEEAQAVAKELALSGERLNRPLPVYLLGEYRHEGKDADRTLSVKLRAERGGQPVGKRLAHSGKPQAAPAAVQAWSAGLLDSLLADGQPRLPADPKAEAKMLVERSKAFQRLGHWEEAHGLLEASLLLDSEATGVRVDAIRSGTEVLASLWGHPYPKPERLPRIRALHAHLMDHLDLLIRGDDLRGYRERNIPGIWATFCGAKNRTSIDLAKPPAEVVALHSEMDLAERTFARRIADRLAPVGLSEAASLILHSVMFRPAKERYDSVEKALADYEKFPGARERAELYAGTVLRMAALRDHRTGKLGSGEKDAYRAFLDRLEASNNPEYSAAAKHIRTTLGDDPGDFVNPPVPGAGQTLLKPIDFESTGVRLQQPHGFGSAAGLDFIWATSGLHLSREKGRVRHVWPPKPIENFSFTQVKYDGKYLWIAGTRLRKPPILVVLDPATERHWDLSAIEGVPEPAEEVFTKLHSQFAFAPLGPGRICLAGSFGRAWIATVAFDEKTGRASGKVFHEAAEVQDRNDATQEAKTNIAFNPEYAFALRSRESKAIRVLLGRSGWYPGRRPLLVDPVEASVRTIGEPLARQLLPHHEGEWFSTADAAYLVEEDPLRSHRNRLVCFFIGPDIRRMVVAEGLPPGDTYVVLHENLFHFARRVPAISRGAKLGPGETPPWEWWICDANGKNLHCVATNLPPIHSIGVSGLHGVVAFQGAGDKIPSIVEHAVAKPLPIALTSSRKCEGEMTARSQINEARSELTLRNETAQPVRLHWLDYGGKRQFYAEIPVGKEFMQPTFIGQAWVLTDRNDDAFEVVRTTEKEQTHAIRKTAKK